MGFWLNMEGIWRSFSDTAQSVHYFSLVTTSTKRALPIKSPENYNNSKRRKSF